MGFLSALVTPFLLAVNGFKMADIELLRSVVAATDGWYCVFSLANGKYPQQSHYKTLEEVQDEAERLTNEGRDAYFSLGKFIDDSSREAENCGWMQSFFLDIDCGPTKAAPDKHGRILGYIDQTAGMVALKDLCKTLKLPRPTIVDSGRGWHVYWPLTEPVEKAKWLPVAETFKALCIKHKLIIDPAVPADAARVLRVPGTKNFKDNPAQDVVVMHTAEPVSFDDFTALMGPLVPVKPVYAPAKLDEFTRAMLGNRQSRFKTILLKTVDGVGCAQLQYIVENQESIEEPLWRAGLSIAKHCVDGDIAIHMISDQHSGYDRDKTERKANTIKGPYTCETFNDFRGGVCTTCPHWGTIKSPIVLGHEIAKAEENAVIEQTDATNGTVAEFVVPKMPSKYFRGKNGGIYMLGKEEDEEEDGKRSVICIYEYDLFVTKRLFDPGAGETILLRLSLPRDGTKDFSVTTEELLSKDEFRKKVSFQGVLARQTQMQNITNYVVDCAKELQITQEVETMRQQFGWTDEDSKFILGSREIGPGYVRYSPPSKTTMEVASALVPVGTLEEWKSVINVYNMPGFEPHAFAVFTAFGAPLIKFLGLKGGIINLLNNRSGTGKSTILQVMNSVWGHPDKLMLQWRDTLNVKLHRMAVMCNLPLGVDEITKMSGDDFSDMAYSVTQGTPRRRMKASVNEERESQGFWATMMVSTSNSSMIDKLQSMKATSEGELMRLMQYRIDPTNNLDKAQAKRIFGKLQYNYGLAGETYAQFLVQNLEECTEMALKIQAKFDVDAAIDTRERFWSGQVASNIAGAMIAKKLGLHDIDVQRVYKWAVSEVQVMKAATKLSMDDYAAVIGEFLLKYNMNILIINRNSTSKSGIAAVPIVQPRSSIIVRYEPDTERIMIVRTALKEFCVDRQITFIDLLDGLNKEGSYISTTRTRIDIGTDMRAPPVEVLEFDAAKLGVQPSVDVPTSDITDLPPDED